MNLRLADKIALVTGGGSGIGEAVCHRFAQEGALVIVTDINGEAAKAVAESINAQQAGRAEHYLQDVTDEAGWDQLLKNLAERHGKLDILVNNAGIAIPANVEQATLADWRQTQAVNGEGVFMGTRAAIGIMKKCGGSIINISSIEGIIGDPNTAAYNYSKGGVRIFTKSAALHCAAQGYPIRVNSVHPGYVFTAMVETGLASMPSDVSSDMLARLQREIPLGKMGEPEDIANGCLFLASDEAKYMTGSELVIDGGYSCH